MACTSALDVTSLDLPKQSIQCSHIYIPKKLQESEDKASLVFAEISVMVTRSVSSHAGAVSVLLSALTSDVRSGLGNGFGDGDAMPPLFPSLSEVVSCDHLPISGRWMTRSSSAGLVIIRGVAGGKVQTPGATIAVTVSSLRGFFACLSCCFAVGHRFATTTTLV
ncbi:hypothetical protein HW555_011162 [Spodoptera exigua]|uniref:Uncharacterized protein n=1 Tax=Spodoptera exigua TaxID=7107 RepID=A0A835G9M6_SPOEX|nr:hypothetical protein HW555_011162 [Spodoptera exigua]